MQSAPQVDEGWIARLDALLEALAEHPDPAVRNTFAEVFAGIRRLHAEGLDRLVQLLAEDQERFTRALNDPAVANLLLLYDLVAVDERQRAEDALESVRSLLESRGGAVELLHIEDGVVHVRLSGSGDAWAVSTEMVVQALDRALAASLPGYRSLEIESPNVRRSGGGWMVDASGSGDWVSFVPLENLRRMEKRVAAAAPTRASGREGAVEPEAAGEPRRVAIVPLEALPENTLYGTIVENLPLLILRGNGHIVAFRNLCPGSLLPLHLGKLEDGVIHCPWHGCRFDAATGEALDPHRAALQSLEVEVQDEQLWLQLT